MRFGDLDPVRSYVWVGLDVLSVFLAILVTILTLTVGFLGNTSIVEYYWRRMICEIQ